MKVLAVRTSPRSIAASLPIRCLGADYYQLMSAGKPPATGSESRKPISLLSLDAGGPQGVSQLLILKDVMDKLSKDENGDSQGRMKRPGEVFDMIGGVGTGGLIAIFLVTLKMTAKEALDEFGKFVVEVFKDVAPDPRRQTAKLARTINDVLGRYGVAKDAKLVPTSEPQPQFKLMVPIMYRNHVGPLCVLRNYTTAHEPPVDITIAEAMLATCSTPPIFTSTAISKEFVTFEYVSAEVGLSNPTREVIAEAHRAFGSETSVSCLLSIGCGHPGVKAVPDDSAGTTWIEFLDGVARDSERTAQDIAAQMSQPTLYHRLSLNCGLEKNRVRGWKDASLATTHTVTYLNDLGVVELVDRCVDAITYGDGSTTLEQLKHSGGGKALPPPLPPLTPNHVERKLPMEFLDNVLFEADGTIISGSKVIVVTGIGGCGKTQVVRKLIEKYLHLFESTFFIDGSSPDTIKYDIVRHVRALGGDHSQKSFKDSMIFLSQALKKGERLLIIDNVDDPALDLARFLPRWQHGVVIVTSRDHSRGQLSPATHLQLDVMTPAESVELLIRGSGKPWPPAESDREPAISVAAELGFHPIALVQAVSYMYNTGCSTRAYITLLRSKRDRLLRDHPATSQTDMRYKTAFAAFDASYNIMPPKARNLWHLLSFFRWQKFPVELITLAALEGFSTDRYPYLTREDEFELGTGCLKEIFYTSERWDPLEFQSTLASLRNHSLVTLTSTENVALLQMHPLVHEWGRLRISEGDLPRFEAAAVRLLCCGARDDNCSMMQYLLPHAESFSSAWHRLHANDAAALAFIIADSGMYEKSATLDSIAYEIVRRELGSEHPAAITAAGNLAVAYGQLGRYAEAAQLHEQVLRQRRWLLGSDHPDTIEVLANLAVVYHMLGRYTEAEEVQIEVLRQRKQLLGVDHPDTIKALENLAITYHDLGFYAKAVNLKLEVLRQRRQLVGEKHRDTLWALASLAATYQVLGHYAEAVELKTEVLQQRKLSLGVDHPDTIRASSSLAVAYYGLGRYAEAEELHTEALEKRISLLGERHPDTIQSMLYLVQTWDGRQRQREASSLAQRAFQITSETLGDGHPLYKQISAFLASLPNQASGQWY